MQCIILRSVKSFRKGWVWLLWYQGRCWVLMYDIRVRYDVRVPPPLPSLPLLLPPSPLLFSSHPSHSPSSPLLPSPAPSAVTDLVATSNPFSVCLSWGEPADNGGLPIEQYRIEIWNRDEYALENFTLVTTEGSNVLTYTVESLNNDTDYRYSGYSTD